MLVVLAYHHREIERTQNLLRWISEIDGRLKHPLVLLASATVPQEAVNATRDLAKTVFASVDPIKQATPDERPWPAASCTMFNIAVRWVEKNRPHTPFLWLEPDCAPMRSGWLDAIEAEYKRAGKVFMGALYDKPIPHLNGAMVYGPGFRQVHPNMLGQTERPWDLVSPEIVMRNGHATHLLQRSLAHPPMNLCHPFTSADELKIIRSNVVLFHGCKSGALIQMLRERSGLVTAEKKKSHRDGMFAFLRKNEPSVSVRRGAAFGDALAATVIAHKLREKGVVCVFRTDPTVAKLLKYCPGLDCQPLTFKPELDAVDVNLDGSYEKHPLRREKHFSEIYVETANIALKGRGIELDAFNCVPRLKPSGVAKLWFWREFKDWPRPWVGIVPRSNNWANRTVPDSTWARAAREINGTCFWLGNHTQSPEGCLQPKISSMVEVMTAISNFDLVISPDTGPAHIAIALDVPTIVIEQSSSPDCHFSDKRDWRKIAPANLTCLNCQPKDGACPLNHHSVPPCQFIDPLEIAKEANRRLQASGVSAVIPIWRPTASRLNACLSALLRQPEIAEIIVTRDDCGIVPTGAMAHPMIKHVASRQSNIGFGRNVNHGFRHTNAEYVLECNDDVVLDDGAVGKMLNIAKADSKCAIVGCLLWYPGRKQIQHGGGKRNSGDTGWGHRDHLASSPSVHKPMKCEFVTAATMLFRREAFYCVGGFDERFFCYFEDCDLCLEMRKAGWNVWYTPHASGIHDEHSSTKTVSTMNQHVDRSAALFKAKWRDYFLHNARREYGNFNYV